MGIGNRVREARTESGMSQEALARRVGVSQGLIGQIETGINRGSKHLAAIARTLNVSVDWLEMGKGEKKRGGHAPSRGGPPDYWPFPISEERFKALPVTELNKIINYMEYVFYQWKKKQQTPSKSEPVYEEIEVHSKEDPFDDRKQSPDKKVR